VAGQLKSTNLRALAVVAKTRILKWPRLFEQKIRVAKWIVGRG
jgi:hypothetical protein